MNSTITSWTRVIEIGFYLAFEDLVASEMLALFGASFCLRWINKYTAIANHYTAEKVKNIFIQFNN